MLHHLETLLKVEGATPAWRALVLYVCLSILVAVAGVIAYLAAETLDHWLVRVIGRVARLTSPRTASTLADVAVRLQALLETARFMTGARVGYGPPSLDRLKVKGIAPTSRLLMPALAEMTATAVMLAAGVVRASLRLTLVNLAIWLAIAWHLGWLDPVADRVASVRWDHIQASQVAATLGLALVVWAVVTRSDVRGRIEFGKAASLECRRRLHEMWPHLRELVLAERAVRKILLSSFAGFPTQAELERLTGHPGLVWRSGRVEVQQEPATPWTDEGEKGPPQAYRAEDAVTGERFALLNAKVTTLRELGYYPQLRRVISPTALYAVGDLQAQSRWYGQRGRAMRDVAWVRALESPEFWALQALWDTVKTEQDRAKALRATERQIRSSATEIHERLWEGACASAGIEALILSIHHRGRERLIDRLMK